MESFKVRKPPLPLDTNSAPARTLASTEAKDSSGSDHRQVGQFRKRCHSRPGRPVIPEPRGVRRLLRRRVAVIGLDESDGNTWLDPFRSSLRNKASGAVCRSEPAFGNRVLDPNVFAHSSGVGLGGIAGMPARELRSGGRVFRRLRFALASRTEPSMAREGSLSSDSCRSNTIYAG